MTAFPLDKDQPVKGQKQKPFTYHHVRHYKHHIWKLLLKSALQKTIYLQFLATVIMIVLLNMSWLQFKMCVSVCGRWVWPEIRNPPLGKRLNVKLLRDVFSRFVFQQSVNCMWGWWGEPLVEEDEKELQRPHKQMRSAFIFMRVVEMCYTITHHDYKRKTTLNVQFVFYKSQIRHLTHHDGTDVVQWILNR